LICWSGTEELLQAERARAASISTCCSSESFLSCVQFDESLFRRERFKGLKASLSNFDFVAVIQASLVATWKLGVSEALVATWMLGVPEDGEDGMPFIICGTSLSLGGSESGFPPGSPGLLEVCVSYRTSVGCKSPSTSRLLK
jgi:hypothetical protein